MNKTSYWKKGGIAGAIFYAFCILVMRMLEGPGQGDPANGIGTAAVVLLFWPAIPLGFILGWLYGKTKK